MTHSENLGGLIDGYVENVVTAAVGPLQSQLAEAQANDAADAAQIADLKAELATAQERIRQYELTPAQPIGEDAPMSVKLSTFPGATADDKLEAGWAYATAQTRPPAVEIDTPDVTFTRPQAITDKKKLIGGPEKATQDRSAKTSSNCVRVSLPNGGAWLRMPSSGKVHDFELSRLSFVGSSTTDLIGGGGGVMWTANLHDISAINFRHVIGSPSAKLLTTACVFGGSWNINNSRGRAITFGGSDNSLWESGLCLVDSPTNLSGTTDAHIVFDYMSKSRVGGLYITAEGGPAGIIINGGASSFGLDFFGIVIEGRNAGAPSLGSVLRINGGTNEFHGLDVNFAGTNFAGSPRAGEQGIISAFGGTSTFFGVQYARATGVGQDVPLIYASGANTKIGAPYLTGAGSGWTDTPAMKFVNGAQYVQPDAHRFV